MTRYVYAPNGVPTTYPYSVEKMKSDNPEVSFPDTIDEVTLAEYNVFPVTPVPAPDAPVTKNVLETSPELVNGEWKQKWAQVDAPPELVAERQKRVAQEGEVNAAQLDNWVSALMNMTPAQVEQFIQTNVTDLSSARNMLSKLAFCVRVLLRREFNV
jgi:hypothetical protein